MGRSGYRKSKQGVGPSPLQRPARKLLQARTDRSEADIECLPMVSSLYGDLPEAKNNAAKSGSDGGGWSSKPKFAPPSRKPAAFGAPRSVLGAAKKIQRDAEGHFALQLLLTSPSCPCFAHSVSCLRSAYSDWDRIQKLRGKYA